MQPPGGTDRRAFSYALRERMKTSDQIPKVRKPISEE